MTDTLIKEPDMIEAEDSPLVQEIQRYLTEFQNAELLDSNTVQDALLDLMLLAKKD